MSASPGHRSPSDTSDEALLFRLGYAQVLYREMGGFSNFAISFTIISILAGCLTSYSIAFNNGGPVAITWGWLLVGGFCILVAMALGEIASAMPTAGALYFWASKLGGPAWGWFTGWTTALGEAWAKFLLLIAVVAQFFCGTASVTSASRMMFAFSRDGAVPGSRVWRRVARNRVPVNAVVAIGVLSRLIMVRPTSTGGSSTTPR